MKKLLFTTAILSVTFFACKKKETTTSGANASLSSVITIKGKASANTDLSNSTLELVPAGTKIVAYVPINDLRLTPDSSQANKFATFTTTVQSDGTYTITIGAPPKDVNVVMHYDDFVLDQIQPTGASPSSIRRTFSFTTDSLVLVSGVTKVKDLIWQ